ncbi:NUDIX hydrolase [uncultured Clostridium sp.]|uniref:NUDIX hydrolase n=1 Tax=uncultured Clostridium sp. TaxID=59620 RepID=UPI0026305481|nr:NUDIX hydrolase [uncultured Clostridium sp.]
MEEKWLTWVKELQSIAQAGITYSKDKFDIERFNRIRELSAEIMCSYTEVENKVIKDLFCNEEGYQTPKVDVRGVVFKEGKILLVKEKIDGKWALPGGWAEFNLSIKENVEKEILEEAGIVAKAKRILAVHDRKKHIDRPCPYGIYKFFVLCDEIEGGFVENIETEEMNYFLLEKLPELSEGRNTYEQIKRCFEIAKENILEAEFD